LKFNKLIVAGHLARDPELRYVNDKTLCMGCVAVDTSWGDKKSVAFIDFTIWGKRAEPYAQNHVKGRATLLEGRLVQENWEDKETGAKRSKLKMNVENWEFMPESSGGGPANRAAAKEDAQAEISYDEQVAIDEGTPF